MYSAKRQFGNIGENVACAFLEKQGFKILDRNYLRKWGEIDIVAEDSQKHLHFVEVKSVSSETLYRPEENMHPQKLKRLSRAIQTYILEKKLDNYDWQIDLVTVRINKLNQTAKAAIVENIII